VAQLPYIVNRLCIALAAHGILAGALAAQDTLPVVGPPIAVVGHWQACIVLVETNAANVPSPNAECGAVEITRDTFTDIGVTVYRVGLRAHHSINLGRLFHSSRWPKVASVTFDPRLSAHRDSTAFQLQLGALGGADNGALVAWVRWTAPGILQGAWELPYSNADWAKGTIVLKRHE
jgi:hypothetical protein